MQKRLWSFPKETSGQDALEKLLYSCWSFFFFFIPIEDGGLNAWSTQLFVCPPHFLIRFCQCNPILLCFFFPFSNLSPKRLVRPLASFSMLHSFGCLFAPDLQASKVPPQYPQRAQRVCSALPNKAKIDFWAKLPRIVSPPHPVVNIHSRTHLLLLEENPQDDAGRRGFASSGNKTGSGIKSRPSQIGSGTRQTIPPPRPAPNRQAASRFPTSGGGVAFAPFQSSDLLGLFPKQNLRCGRLLLSCG